MNRFAISLVMLATVVGCVHRLEVVAVYTDGSVDLVAAYAGSPADLRSGDAIPLGTNGWNVREHEQALPEGGWLGDKQLYYSATLHLKPGEAAPASYARPGTPLAELCLVMPTHIEVKQSEKGTTYSFTRTYRLRHALPSELLRHPLLNNDGDSGLQIKDPKNLTPDESRKLAELLVDYECTRHRLLVDEAAGASAKLPESAAGLREPCGPDHANALAKDLVEQGAASLAEAGIIPAAFDLQRLVRRAIVAKFTVELAAADLPAVEKSRLEVGYERLDLAWTIAEDLLNDFFEVFVFLPGKITSHNADDRPSDLTERFTWTSEIFPRPGYAEIMPIAQKMLAERAPQGYQLVSWTLCSEEIVCGEVVLKATSFVAKEPWPAARRFVRRNLQNLADEAEELLKR